MYVCSRPLGSVHVSANCCHVTVGHSRVIPGLTGATMSVEFYVFYGFCFEQTVNFLEKFTRE